MAQFTFERWRELVGGASALPADDETQPCKGCGEDVPWRRGYVLFDSEGEEVGVFCLGCALRPCDPDCTCEACEHGGADRTLPAADEPEYVARVVTCPRCDGEPTRAGCWACCGDGELTTYEPRRTT